MSTNYLAQLSVNLSTFNAVNINYNTLTGSTITGSTILNNTITTRQVNFSTLTGSTLTVGNIQGTSVSASTITTTGNVGIGVTTPNAPLQFLNVTANRKIVLYETTNNDHQYFGFGVNANILRYQVDATNANHVFYAGASSTTSNELMRISGNGNVGIGTTNPSTTLHVNGGITATLSAMPASDSASLLSINNSGVINKPAVFTYTFTAGGSGGALSAVITNYVDSGVYILQMSGAGSDSRYAAIISYMSGHTFPSIILPLITTALDGYSTMFTINGGQIQWNYTALPNSSWPVYMKFIPLIGKI